MPAAQLELDAHSMDRPLFDGSVGHLQLLAALMKAGDWKHALLMLDWMQGVLGVQAANDIAISTAMLAHLKRLLEPCYKSLYPKGPLGGNILHKPPYDLGPKGFGPGFSSDSQNPGPGPEALKPQGPELEPLGYKLLEHAGVYVYRDPEVLVMLLRVLQHELLFYGGMVPPEWQQQQQQQQVNAEKVSQVCKVLSEVALPALSLNQANRALAYEVWEVLQLLPFHDRAEVYRQGLAACSACPPAAAAGQMAVKAFKKIKARLALPDKADKGRKNVVRANANLLSKVSHATPLQVADQVLWQAASFPNAVEPLAEVLKLPNPLTMDVLTYMALYWWGRLGRSKMKEDGANEEDWVSGVADLVGIACCHSKHNFKLHTLLPYLFDELRGGDTMAVLLLRSIIRQMTGVDGPANVDPSQANLLCCGTVMQAEAIHSVANREESAYQMGRSTLLKVLTDGAPDQQLLLPLAVVMAQHLDWSLFTLHTQHLKELAEQHDRVNEICHQYIMMLEHCVLRDQEMELRDYAAALPPLHVLIRQYRVHPGIAWMLWRPVIAALEPQLMAKVEAQALEAAAAAEDGEEGEAEVLPDAAAAAAAASSGSSTGKVVTAAAAAADGEEGELPEEGEAMQGMEGPGAARAAAAAAAVAAAESAAKLKLPLSFADVEASVQQIDDTLFKTLREPLYIAFWSLRPEEMHVPTEMYDARITEMETFLRTCSKEASQLQTLVDADIRTRDRMQSSQAPHRGNPRDYEMQFNRLTDNITAKSNQLAEIDKKAAHFKAVLGPLRAERDALLARHRQVLKRLEAEKDTYMSQNRIVKPLAVAFIKHCLVPRLTRSLADATYCHHFTMKLHTMDTPNWPAAFFWDYAVTGLTNMIPTVTEKEALCVGLFLTLLLQDLQVWYFDEQRYRRDCNQQTMKFTAQNPTPATFQHFQKLFKKWQNELFKSLKSCAQGGEYLQKRNALLIMSKMIQAAPTDKPPMFPVYTSHCEQMKEAMEEIQQKDAREDVKKMAQALAIQLSNKLSNCVPIPQDPGKAKLGARGAPVRGPPPKRKPPASPGKQPGSRPSTPPPAATATAAATAVRAEAGAAEPSATTATDEAATDKAATVKTEEGAKGTSKPTSSAGGAAAGPRAVRKGPAGSGSTGGAASGAAKQDAAAPKQQQQQQQGNKPPRPASADGEPARKRPRVTPPSGKADGAAAGAAAEQEPGEVMEAADAANGDVAAGSEGAAAGGSKAATSGGEGKPRREAVPRPIKKAAVAAVAAAAAAAAADARGRKGGGEQKEDEKAHDKEQQRQEGRARHDAADRGRGHHAHHLQQDEAAGTASPARGHRGERGASPGSKEQQQPVQKQQQQQSHERGGDRERERDGRDGGSRHHSREGREPQDEGTTAGGKGGSKRKRGGSGSGGAGEKAAEGDKTPSQHHQQQQQQREDRDRPSSKPRDRDKERERDGTPGGEGGKEQQGRSEKERDRKRDRRDPKGSGDRQQQQQQQQQPEDKRDKGAREGGSNRDEALEPAKKRRLDDDRSADGSGREPKQQPSRRQPQDKHQPEQQQQEQRRSSKHTPIMAPADDAKGGRKDGGGGGHERGGDERQYGGGSSRRR